MTEKNKVVLRKRRGSPSPAHKKRSNSKKRSHYVSILAKKSRDVNNAPQLPNDVSTSALIHYQDTGSAQSTYASKLEGLSQSPAEIIEIHNSELNLKTPKLYEAKGEMSNKTSHILIQSYDTAQDGHSNRKASTARIGSGGPVQSYDVIQLNTNNQNSGILKSPNVQDTKFPNATETRISIVEPTTSRSEKKTDPVGLLNKKKDKETDRLESSITNEGASSSGSGFKKTNSVIVHTKNFEIRKSPDNNKYGSYKLSFISKTDESITTIPLRYSTESPNPIGVPRYESLKNVTKERLSQMKKNEKYESIVVPLKKSDDKVNEFLWKQNYSKNNGVKPTDNLVIRLKSSNTHEQFRNVETNVKKDGFNYEQKKLPLKLVKGKNEDAIKGTPSDVNKRSKIQIEPLDSFNKFKRIEKNGTDINKLNIKNAVSKTSKSSNFGKQCDSPPNDEIVKEGIKKSYEKVKSNNVIETTEKRRSKSTKVNLKTGNLVSLVVPIQSSTCNEIGKTKKINETPKNKHDMKKSLSLGKQNENKNFCEPLGPKQHSFTKNKKLNKTNNGFNEENVEKLPTIKNKNETDTFELYESAEPLIQKTTKQNECVSENQKVDGFVEKNLNAETIIGENLEFRKRVTEPKIMHQIRTACQILEPLKEQKRTENCPNIPHLNQNSSIMYNNTNQPQKKLLNSPPIDQKKIPVQPVLQLENFCNGDIENKVLTEFCSCISTSKESSSYCECSTCDSDPINNKNIESITGVCSCSSSSSGSVCSCSNSSCYDSTHANNTNEQNNNIANCMSSENSDSKTPIISTDSHSSSVCSDSMSVKCVCVVSPNTCVTQNDSNKPEAQDFNSSPNNGPIPECTCDVCPTPGSNECDVCPTPSSKECDVCPTPYSKECDPNRNTESLIQDSTGEPLKQILDESTDGECVVCPEISDPEAKQNLVPETTDSCSCSCECKSSECFQVSGKEETESESNIENCTESNSSQSRGTVDMALPQEKGDCVKTSKQSEDCNVIEATPNIGESVSKACEQVRTCACLVCPQFCPLTSQKIVPPLSIHNITSIVECVHNSLRDLEIKVQPEECGFEKVSEKASIKQIFIKSSVSCCKRQTPDILNQNLEIETDILCGPVEVSDNLENKCTRCLSPCLQETDVLEPQKENETSFDSTQSKLRNYSSEKVHKPRLNINNLKATKAEVKKTEKANLLANTSKKMLNKQKKTRSRSPSPARSAGNRNKIIKKDMCTFTEATVGSNTDKTHSDSSSCSGSSENSEVINKQLKDVCTSITVSEVSENVNCTCDDELNSNQNKLECNTLPTSNRRNVAKKDFINLKKIPEKKLKEDTMCIEKPVKAIDVSKSSKDISVKHNFSCSTSQTSKAAESLDLPKKLELTHRLEIPQIINFCDFADVIVKKLKETSDCVRDNNQKDNVYSYLNTYNTPKRDLVMSANVLAVCPLKSIQDPVESLLDSCTCTTTNTNTDTSTRTYNTCSCSCSNETAENSLNEPETSSECPLQMLVEKSNKPVKMIIQTFSAKFPENKHEDMNMCKCSVCEQLEQNFTSSTSSCAKDTELKNQLYIETHKDLLTESDTGCSCEICTIQKQELENNKGHNKAHQKKIGSKKDPQICVLPFVSIPPEIKQEVKLRNKDNFVMTSVNICAFDPRPSPLQDCNRKEGTQTILEALKKEMIPSNEPEVNNEKECVFIMKPYQLNKKDNKFQVASQFIETPKVSKPSTRAICECIRLSKPSSTASKKIDKNLCGNSSQKQSSKSLCEHSSKKPILFRKYSEPTYNGYPSYLPQSKSTVSKKTTSSKINQKSCQTSLTSLRNTLESKTINQIEKPHYDLLRIIQDTHYALGFVLKKNMPICGKNSSNDENRIPSGGVSEANVAVSNSYDQSNDRTSQSNSSKVKGAQSNDRISQSNSSKVKGAQSNDRISQSNSSKVKGSKTSHVEFASSTYSKNSGNNSYNSSEPHLSVTSSLQEVRSNSLYRLIDGIPEVYQSDTESLPIEKISNTQLSLSWSVCQKEIDAMEKVPSIPQSYASSLVQQNYETSSAESEMFQIKEQNQLKNIPQMQELFFKDAITMTDMAAILGLTETSVEKISIDSQIPINPRKTLLPNAGPTQYDYHVEAIYSHQINPDYLQSLSPFSHQLYDFDKLDEIDCLKKEIRNLTEENRRYSSNLREYVEEIVLEVNDHKNKTVNEKHDDAVTNQTLNLYTLNKQKDLRRKKNENSFPVTIQSVRPLGKSSLIVQWFVKDSSNIGGFEVSVDGTITNRYYSNDYMSCVVFGINILSKHIIILNAFPKCIKHHVENDINNAYTNLLSNRSYICDPSYWTPSCYFYKPSNLSSIN